MIRNSSPQFDNGVVAVALDDQLESNRLNMSGADEPSAPEAALPRRSPAKRSFRSPYFTIPKAPTPDSGIVGDDNDSTKNVTPKKRRPDLSTSLSTSSSPPKKPRPARGILSCLPVPPLSADRFGLAQEDLAHDPFRLLIALTFLTRTPGRVSIPVFQELMQRYPTPEALAAADPAVIIPVIKHLGLADVRCAAIRRIARRWVERPPCRGVRFAVKHYPNRGDGRDIKRGEEFGPEDDFDVGDVLEEEDIVSESDVGVTAEPPPPSQYQHLPFQARGRGSAWEIGHLTQGRYALDSWRIFCRDVLLGRAEDWTGRGGVTDEDGTVFQPEWMRVLPEDKELRAYLRWMWMKEGWEIDFATGEREVLREEMRLAVDEGRVGYDEQGLLEIVSPTALENEGGTRSTDADSGP